MSVYIYPKGSKFSGQTTIGDAGAIEFDATINVPIYHPENGVFSYLLKYSEFMRRLWALRSRHTNFTISMALSTSFLLRLMPVLMVSKNKIHVECHSGPAVKITRLSYLLLTLMAMKTEDLQLLGELPEVEAIFLRKNVSVFYFSNTTELRPSEEISLSSRAFDYGFLALNIESKGYRRFIEVFESLKSRDPKVTAVLAGPFHRSAMCPPEHTEMRFRDDIRRFTKLGGVYVESVSAQEKVTFFQGIRRFLFLSDFVGEAQPMVLLEAQACGCQIYSLTPGFVAKMELQNSMLFDRYQDLERHLLG